MSVDLSGFDAQFVQHPPDFTFTVTNNFNSTFTGSLLINLLVIPVVLSSNFLQIQKNGISTPIYLTLPIYPANPIILTPLYDPTQLTILTEDLTTSFEFNSQVIKREFIILAATDESVPSSMIIDWQISGDLSHTYELPPSITVDLIGILRYQ